ncbi:lanthionine synthetase LanC family protein [Sphingobacterium lactis]|uniref:lanthionine synthetase LanC family protein n=1 Tax=Sphingobacterium lactis TaxID=797291 RepID=UPI003EC7BEFA
MRDTLKIIIDDIYNKVIAKPENGLSLFSGEAGRLLFKMIYLKKYKDDDIIENMDEQFQFLAEESFDYTYPTICNGKSGINWLFCYFYYQNQLDYETLNIICWDNENLAKMAINYIKSGNIDFLHGGLGISYYLLYNPDFRDVPFFETVFNLLLEINEKFGGRIPYWDFETANFMPDKLNLGLSHGLPSILKFCIQSYNSGICKAHAHDLAKRIVNSILKIKPSGSPLIYYPSIYDFNDTTDRNYHSRLAWCYGDLSLGYILLQYSLTFKDKEVELYSKEILLSTTKRQSLIETQINDVGICHGISGVIHIYNKLWHLTNDTVFKDACDYWLVQIINTWEKDNDIIYKKFNSSKGVFEPSNGLLEGSIGVGLVLFSFLHEEFSWDYCLMLNQ